MKLIVIDNKIIAFNNKTFSATGGGLVISNGYALMYDKRVITNS